MGNKCQVLSIEGWKALVSGRVCSVLFDVLSITKKKGKLMQEECGGS